jgi:glycosyltransferase involved in cell wall biosynthesis
VETNEKRILALFSDVNFSPQLVAILEELFNRGVVGHVVLIGEADMQIASQIQSRGWNYKVICKRGKFSSVINLVLVGVEIFRFRPRTLFASGQFATVLGIISAKFLRVPNRVFIRHHSSFHHKFKMRLGIAIDRVTNCLATDIVAVSETVRNILIQNELVNPTKITVIQNGVNLIEFKSNYSKAAARNQVQDLPLFHIGVISRLTEWKGVQYTASAFVRLQREFPESRLHIVGAHAECYLDVKHILSNVSSEKYTLDEINTNIPKYLSDLDVFIHVPVGIDDEAFGIVYIEALSSGIPCIFTKSGVLNELDDLESYAHMVPFRDSEEIYQNLKKMIQGVDEKRLPVPQSWLDQFSLDLMAKRYADLLLSVAR